MFYREAGDFKTSYQDDNQTFPIKFDRYRYYFVLFVAFAIIPFMINDYWVNAVFLPFLIYAIAALGLNILTGYCGQVSLGTVGFMAVGAYAVYKLMTMFPEGPSAKTVWEPLGIWVCPASWTRWYGTLACFARAISDGKRSPSGTFTQIFFCPVANHRSTCNGWDTPALRKA